MALSSPSLFLYNFEITPTNRFISFGNSPTDLRTATLELGFYSLSGLGDQIISALQEADPLNEYLYSVDRTIAGGTQNRFTISTASSYLRLLFSSGNPSNPASLIGFNLSDYVGAASYSGSASCGTVLIPNQLGYTYLGPTDLNKNFGMINISASGVKEALTFSLQNFWQVQFKYITKAVRDSQWTPLVQWMIQQREFEFTPEISNPTVFYVGTLDNPSNGLEFNFSEMLPDFPNNYQTPLNIYRVRNES